MKEYLEKRIKELYEADAAFCKDRWDMTKSQMERSTAREWSNNVTFARQELQAVLEIYNSLNPMKTASIGMSGYGYIELTTNRDEKIYVNIRAIMRYEFYQYSFREGEKSELNSRLYYLDGYSLNIKETTEEISEKIKQATL